MPESPENTDAGNQAEVISERTDEAAEEEFIKESQINDLRDKMVADFDTGFSNWGDDTSFKEAYQSALNTLIQNEVSKLVNVNDLSTLEPEKMDAIKAAVTARMEAFQRVLESNVGYVRDVSDVADTKKSFSGVFSYQEFTPQANFGEVEGSRKAEVSMDLQGTIEKPESLNINYQEEGGEGIQMSIRSNDSFFASTEKTTPGSLADRINKNRDIYMVAGVSYRIEKPQEFRTFLQEELKAQGLDLKTITEKEGLTAAVEIVKKQLNAPDSAEEKKMANLEHPSNKTPIDQLIMGKGFGVCRHYTVAARVVFEQFQAMAKENENNNLADTVVIENNMDYLNHGTLAIARGDSITTMDAYWYATGSSKSMDSTFDGKHGNVSSLFQTLSRVPIDQPENKIFDISNSAKVTDELLSKYGEKGMGMLDNRDQWILATADAVLENKDLQTTATLNSQAKNLNIMARELRQKNQKSEITQVFKTGLENLATSFKELIEKKIAANNPPLSPDELEGLKMSRGLLVLALRSVKGGDLNTAVVEETSDVSEKTKEELNYHQANYLYEDTKSMLNTAFAAGKQLVNSPYAGTFESKYLQPAIEAAGNLQQFVLNNELWSDQRISGDVNRSIGVLEKLVNDPNELVQQTAKAALPTFQEMRVA